MRHDDLEDLADLHIAAFGNRGHSVDDIRRFHQRLLVHTLDDDRPGVPAPHTLVGTRNGTITSMMYLAHSPMRLHDRPIWASATAILAVHPDHRDPEATTAFLQAILEDGPAEYVLCDGSNAGARRAIARVPSATVHQQYSLRWWRALNPMTAAFSGVLNRSRRSSRTATSAVRSAASGLDKTVDRFAPKIVAKAADLFVPDPRRVAGFRTTELTAADLVAHSGTVLDGFALRPDYESPAYADSTSARFSSVKPGGSVDQLAIWDSSDELAGWFELHREPTGTAEVVQLASRPDTAAAVIAILFEHAKDQGAGSVHGCAAPAMFIPLAEAGARFHGGASTKLVVTKNAEVRQAFHTSSAFSTAIEGEYPMRLSSRSSLL